MSPDPFKYANALNKSMVKARVEPHIAHRGGKAYRVKGYEREIGVRTTPRGGHKQPGGAPTMFFEPRSTSLAEIITLKDPAHARLAARELEGWRGRANVRRTIAAMNLAANRAEASLKRKKAPLSRGERREMRVVAAIYRAAVKRQSRKLARM